MSVYSSPCFGSASVCPVDLTIPSDISSLLVLDPNNNNKIILNNNKQIFWGQKMKVSDQMIYPLFIYTGIPQFMRNLFKSFIYNVSKYVKLYCVHN